MKKRWVLKEEFINYLKEYNLNAVNIVKDLDAIFNEGKQERTCLRVNPFERYSHIELTLWRDECCEQVEVECPEPNEIQIVPIQLSIWKRIKRFLEL